MMLIDVYLAQSPLHGVGVFTRQFIPKDTLIWEFIEGFDHIFTRDAFDALPETAKDFIRHHGHHERVTPDVVYLCADLAKFMNFSKTDSNLRDTVYKTYALRDIGADEELIFNPFANSDLHRESDYKLDF